MLYGLLGFSVLVSLFGMVNTLVFLGPGAPAWDRDAARGSACRASRHAG